MIAGAANCLGNFRSSWPVAYWSIARRAFGVTQKFISFWRSWLIVSARLGIYAFYPASLAVVVIYMCDIFPYLGRISKYGDFSYGLYVCHFPVIQSFATLALLAEYPGLRAVITLLSCLLCAVLSWHLVEKWWLRPKHHSSPLVVSQAPPVETPIQADLS